MPVPSITRRSFTLTATGLLGSAVREASGATMTGRDVMARIQSNLNTPLPGRPVDGFKAGNPDVAVKGIATTAMATMDVLREAAKRNLNLVITFENVYFGQTQPMGGGQAGGRGRGQGQTAVNPANPNDPVYKAKKEFIEQHGLTVFRLRDQWLAHADNPLARGLGDALGWSSYQLRGDPTSYELPPVKLDALVAGVRKRLQTRAGVRVVGERETVIRKVAVIPGSVSIETAMKRFPQVDLLIAGQSQEWDVAEYAFDTAAAGWKKGYVMLGVVVSEEPGMRLCSNWIKSVVTEMPVEWIGTGDPYWRPA